MELQNVSVRNFLKKQPELIEQENLTCSFTDYSDMQ